MSSPQRDYRDETIRFNEPAKPMLMKAWAQKFLLELSPLWEPKTRRTLSQVIEGIEPPFQPSPTPIMCAEKQVEFPLDECDVRVLQKEVDRIPRDTPAIDAEVELKRILVTWMPRIWHVQGEYLFWPAMMRLASEMLRYYRMAGRREMSIGRVLGNLREDSWESWFMDVSEFGGDDPDTEPNEFAQEDLDAWKFGKVLRLGPAGASMERMEAVQLLASYLFSSEKLASWSRPADAIEDVVAWARCAWCLRNGEAQTIRQICKNAWNSMLPLAPASVAMLYTTMAVEPCSGSEDPKKPAGKKRVGLLRLVRRLCAQRDFWRTIGEVELPTDWLTDAKDPSDAKGIIGFSNNTYGAVMKKMAALGILVPIAEPNRAAHQCTRYELQLMCGDDSDADDALVPDAENLVRNSPDHAIEKLLKILTKEAAG